MPGFPETDPCRETDSPSLHLDWECPFSLRSADAPRQGGCRKYPARPTVRPHRRVRTIKHQFPGDLAGRLTEPSHMPTFLPMRTFGTTPLRVTPLCIGCAQLGNMPETFTYEVAEEQ